jgi:hypothetical protein
MKTKWQYTVHTDRSTLAALGQEGWELVSVAVIEGRETFYMKKPSPSIREQITLDQRDNVLYAAASTPKEGGASL